MHQRPNFDSGVSNLSRSDGDKYDPFVGSERLSLYFDTIQLYRCDMNPIKIYNVHFVHIAECNAIKDLLWQVQIFYRLEKIRDKNSSKDSHQHQFYFVTFCINSHVYNLPFSMYQRLFTSPGQNFSALDSLSETPTFLSSRCSGFFRPQHLRQ